MTTIVTLTLTQAAATLQATITTIILAATASAANTPPDCTLGRRCFRVTIAGAGDAVIAATNDMIGTECRFRVLLALTDRDHSDAPSIGRLHALAEKRARIVTGRDSVPVGRSTVVPVSVPIHDPKSNEAWSVESSSVEASSVEASSVEAVPMGAASLKFATAPTPDVAAPEAAATRPAARRTAPLG